MNNTPKKAVIAGHICLDITPLFPQQWTPCPAENPVESLKPAALDEIMIPGKLIHMEGVDVHTGGAVANTGLGMKILGADVKLMGKIGNDEFGKIILRILKQYGYDGSEDMIRTDEIGTSYSVVLALPDIDRIFLHSPGANDTFCCQDLNFKTISEAALFHFGYPPLMYRMYERDGEELLQIFQKVKSYNTATSLDLAAVDAASEAGKADWEKILSKVLPYVDFFVPSVEELCFMLDRERYEEWLKRAEGADVTFFLDIEKDVKPLADKLLAMGAKVILIKCGAPGLYYRTAEEKALQGIGEKVGLQPALWAEKEGFERSYRPDRVLSGTGAGDTSIAAFLTAMLQGKKAEDCVRLAAATGASCVESYDALSGLRQFTELEQKINAGWEKQYFGRK